MALHRDIYWIGRQWAVTGHGLQAIDQRLRGVFDIEMARIWDEHALDALRANEWLNPVDFDKAIAAARKRYPEPARKAALPVETLPRLSNAGAPAPVSPPPSPLASRLDSELPRADVLRRLTSTPERLASIPEPTPLAEERLPDAVPAKFAASLQVSYHGELARFAPQWRVRQ
jgi:hypothetical protein